MTTLTAPTPRTGWDEAGSTAAEDRLGRALAVRLGELTQSTIAPDIAERLRFSRERALARARQQAAAIQTGGVAVGAPMTAVGFAWAGGVGGPGAQRPAGNLRKWASLLPLAVLVSGFMLVHDLLDTAEIRAAADVDSALLVDDLPPAAYSDPGFAEFLRSRQP